MRVWPRNAPGWCSAFALAVVLLSPLPAAADGLQDFLLLDSSIDDTRLRIAHGQLMSLMQMRRGCINATPMTSGYWVPRPPQRLVAMPFPEASPWLGLEAALAWQRAGKQTPDLCREVVQFKGVLVDPWLSIYDRSHEEYQYMLALGSSHLEDPQRLVLGIVFSDVAGAEAYELVPGGPAERAGMQRGDQLITVAGEPVVSSEGVVVQLAAGVAGRPVVVGWVRRLADGQLLQGISEVIPLPLEAFLPERD